MEQSNLIKTVKDGNTWTLTLSKSAERKSKIIKIKKDWAMTVIAFRGKSVDWSTILKVWLFIIGNEKPIITAEEIAELINVSESQVSEAKKVLTEINAVEFKIHNVKDAFGNIRCLGSEPERNAWISV